MAQPNAFGLTSLYDPSIAQDQAALDRQTALAQALRQQSMTAPQAPTQAGSRMSPLWVIAKALQAYKANEADKKNDESRLTLAQKQAAAILPAMNDMMGGAPGQGGVPSGQGGASVAPGAPQGSGFTDGTPEAAPAQPASSAETQGDRLKRSARAALLMGNTELANKLIANYLELTPEQKNMAAKGQNPQEIGAIETQKLRKEANAPTRLGNSAYADVEGNIRGLPSQIPGAVNVADPSNPSGWKTMPVPGALPAIQGEKAAAARGEGENIPQPTFDREGNPQPLQSRTAVLGGLPAQDARGNFQYQVSPQEQGGRDATRVSMLKTELGQETNPSVAGAIKTEIANTGKGAAYAAPPLGSEHAQRGLDTAWEALKGANREAQNTKSYLQNIQTAAEKGAIVGPGADRREMIQGMLQLAGIKEEVNTNATTQTQLLDKYSNQIVARLGQGGLGTDAARAILASAYPGKHMNVEAIREAVGNLNGAQDMTQAKTRFLTDAASRRDAKTYQEREVQFDQAADPRIWQYKAIRDPAQRKAFAQMVLKQDPTFPDRIQKLESLGAL